MSLSHSELQKIKSLIGEKINVLIEHQIELKRRIGDRVAAKHRFVRSGNKNMVDSYNEVLRIDHNKLSNLSEKIHKLGDLQRSIKNEMRRVNETTITGADIVTNCFVNVSDFHDGYHSRTDGLGNVPFYSDAVTYFSETTKNHQEKVEPVKQDVSSKPSNPKDLIGSGKLPLHLWPATATAMGCVGFLNGMLKYGRSNFRAVGIRGSIYYDAAIRHLNAWFEGEEYDPDDGVPHLAAALACIAIIVDAISAGKFTDDRAISGGYRELMGTLTPHVARLKKLHEGKTPKHYTIADDPKMF